MTTLSAVEVYDHDTRRQSKNYAIHGWTGLEGRVSLRAFQEMDNATRCATWQAMTYDDQLGLVLQILRLKGRELTAARITGWLAVMGERFGSSQEARGWRLETSTGHPPLAPRPSSLVSPLAPVTDVASPAQLASFQRIDCGEVGYILRCDRLLPVVNRLVARTSMDVMVVAQLIHATAQGSRLAPATIAYNMLYALRFQHSLLQTADELCDPPF